MNLRRQIADLQTTPPARGRIGQGYQANYKNEAHTWQTDQLLLITNPVADSNGYYPAKPVAWNGDELDDDIVRVELDNRPDLDDLVYATWIDTTDGGAVATDNGLSLYRGVLNPGPDGILVRNMETSLIIPPLAVMMVIGNEFLADGTPVYHVKRPDVLASPYNNQWLRGNFHIANDKRPIPVNAGDGSDIKLLRLRDPFPVQYDPTQVGVDQSTGIGRVFGPDVASFKLIPHDGVGRSWQSLGQTEDVTIAGTTYHVMWCTDHAIAGYSQAVNGTLATPVDAVVWKGVYNTAVDRRYWTTGSSDGVFTCQQGGMYSVRFYATFLANSQGTCMSGAIAQFLTATFGGTASSSTLNPTAKQTLSYIQLSYTLAAGPTLTPVYTDKSLGYMQLVLETIVRVRDAETLWVILSNEFYDGNGNTTHPDPQIQDSRLEIVRIGD